MKFNSSSGARSLVIAVLTVLGCVSGNNAKAQILIHNYNFSNNTGADSVGNANGSLTGSAAIFNQSLHNYGDSGAGLALNGPSVTNSAVSGITGSFTLEDYVYLPNTLDGRHWPILFSFGKDTGDFIFSHDYTDYGGPSTIELNSGASGYAYLDLNHGQPIQAGSSVVAVTYDATTMIASAYLDGTFEASAQLSGAFDLSAVSGTATGGVGGYSPYGDPSVNETVQDFAIYSGALSADQILIDDISGAPVSGVVDVPEPGTWAMLTMGVYFLFVVRRLRTIKL